MIETLDRAVIEDHGGLSLPAASAIDPVCLNRGYLGVAGADSDSGLEEFLTYRNRFRIRDALLDVVDRRRQRPLKRRGDARLEMMHIASWLFDHRGRVPDFFSSSTP